MQCIPAHYDLNLQGPTTVFHFSGGLALIRMSRYLQTDLSCSILNASQEPIRRSILNRPLNSRQQFLHVKLKGQVHKKSEPLPPPSRYTEVLQSPTVRHRVAASLIQGSEIPAA